MISIVTWNRRRILAQAIQAIEATTREDFHLFVTDNHSEDGTPEFLHEYSEKYPGRLDYYLMDENIGLAPARNAHWDRCIGHDTLRMDDKIEIQSVWWSQLMRRDSARRKAIIAFTDPDTDFLWHQGANEHALVSYAPWKCGAAMFVPGELSAALGAWDEIPGVKYGWEDLLWMDRAEALGWEFVYSLSAYAMHLARASAATRETAMSFEPAYKEIRAAYQSGERDLFIAPESTNGGKIGARSESALIRRGTAMSLAYP